MSKFKESATLRASRIKKERLKNNLPVYDAGLGANPIKQPRLLIYSLTRHSNKKNYTSANGIDLLKNTIKKKYSNENYIVENTLVLNGLKEMIFILLLAFKGTTILLSPHWVSYEEQLRILHKDYISLKTEDYNDYKIKPEELDFNFSLIKGNKLLILNNPCNPTGVVYSKNELEKIAKICKKHNVLVFADEIYLDLVYDTEYTRSFSYFYEKTIVGCSLSKGYACGGYRLGWLTFPKILDKLYRVMFRLSSSIISCASEPLQMVAVSALSDKKKIFSFLEKERLLFKFVRDYVYARLRRMNLRLSNTKSAWYIFVNFRNYQRLFNKLKIETSTELSERLINDIGLITVPGEAFGYKGFNVRYSFVDLNKKLINLELYNLDEILTENLLINIKKGLDELKKWLSG